MNFRIIPIITASIVLLSSCEKEENDNPDNNNTPEVALPVTCDLGTASIQNGTTSFNVSGITFSGGNAYNAGQWQDCITASTSFAENHWHDEGLILAYPEFNTLIANLSPLSEINKISVRLSNNCGSCTRISVCDANGFVKEVLVGRTDDTTVTMTLDSKKLSALYVSCLEGAVYNVTIE